MVWPMILFSGPQHSSWGPVSLSRFLVSEGMGEWLSSWLSRSSDFSGVTQRNSKKLRTDFQVLCVYPAPRLYKESDSPSLLPVLRLHPPLAEMPHLKHLLSSSCLRP